MARNRIVPIIMCGGSGTRLWPMSRDTMPKQFIALFDERSSFQRIMALVSDDSVFARPVVITNFDYRFTVRDQLQGIGVAADIILEPARRDSAAAVAVGTEYALKQDPDALVGIFAADHVMQDEAEFVATCRRAAEAAATGTIVTIGIRPTHPATGYGYILPGTPLEGAGQASAVASFVEKPDVERASRYILDGYLWNSGNFIFSARTMQAELTAFAPDVIGPAAEALASAGSDLGFVVLDKDAFSRAAKTSIDYAVMERTKHAAVVPGSFGWSDIGGWNAVWDLAPKDEAGNAILGKGYVLHGSNNLIRSEGDLVAVVGVDDIAVISTGDAVLVVPRERAGAVKDLVEILKQAKEPAAVEHREIHRPWGKYDSVDTGARHQVKRITVKPGGVLSLQKHYHRSEHWVVVKGTAEVTRDDAVIVVHENESVYLPIGCVHRLANPGKIPLEIIEVQVGSYLGEDDIIRISDAYQRN